MSYIDNIPEDFNPMDSYKDYPKDYDNDWDFERREDKEEGLSSPTTLKLRKIPR